jgi:hypothetical protein
MSLLQPLVYTMRGNGDCSTSAGFVHEVGEVPFTGTVTGVRCYPTTSEAGHGSNHHTFTLTNHATGSGTTVIATQTSDTDATGDAALVADTQYDVTLSAVANATVVTAGDVLEFKDVVGGTITANNIGYEIDITRS